MVMRSSSRLLSVILLSIATFTAVPAHASSDAEHPVDIHWPFDGMFGAVDRQAAQRGFQVYKEVCASCHSLHRVAFRSLTEIGFSEAEVKALAAEYSVMDGPNDDGEMFERAARPSDHFVAPFPNDKAARASNNGAYPPDLDLIIKSRMNGPDYVYSLLTGYHEKPEHVELRDGMNYNPYFPGAQIGMPAPLSEGAVEYQDGTPATVDRMARDVVIFLQWAAEPEMEARKSMGIKVLMFLALFTVLFYFAKKVTWRNVK